MSGARGDRRAGTPGRPQLVSGTSATRRLPRGEAAGLGEDAAREGAREDGRGGRAREAVHASDVVECGMVRFGREWP